MNENIDLTKILKDCPRGTKFYTPIWGEVSFEYIYQYQYPTNGEFYSFAIDNGRNIISLSKKGCYIDKDDAECIIFPSKDQRDWRKFNAPWYKKEKFDPKTLKPFDKVLVRDRSYYTWACCFFSHIINTCEVSFKFRTVNSCYNFCIPYNDETKHLLGTTDEAPEYYRYWEDEL